MIRYRTDLLDVETALLDDDPEPDDDLEPVLLEPDPDPDPDLDPDPETDPEPDPLAEPAKAEVQGLHAAEFPWALKVECPLELPLCEPEPLELPLCEAEPLELPLCDTDELEPEDVSIRLLFDEEEMLPEFLLDWDPLDEAEWEPELEPESEPEPVDPFEDPEPEPMLTKPSAPTSSQQGKLSS